LERASIVLSFGEIISIILLWTSISKCSLAFLSTCGEVWTTVKWRSVGRGTGPIIFEPLAKTASTIFAAASSITLWSYDFKRTRILPATAIWIS